MATVMSWGDSSGTRGRCDDKCHSAVKPHCDCMCGGRYHGAALRPGGVDKVREECGAEILEGARRRCAEEGLTFEAWERQASLLGVMGELHECTPARD